MSPATDKLVNLGDCRACHHRLGVQSGMERDQRGVPKPGTWRSQVVCLSCGKVPESHPYQAELDQAAESVKASDYRQQAPMPHQYHMPEEWRLILDRQDRQDKRMADLQQQVSSMAEEITLLKSKGARARN
jgi:hypothetical protein